MLIDEFLPTFDVAERYRVNVSASPDKVYAAARRMDISDATLTRWLFRLRGIPASSKFTREDFIKMRFVLLGEKPEDEILLGLVGRFWTASGGLRRVNVEEYRRFSEPGYAKAAWNFHLVPQADNTTTILETETRVYCTDDTSRRKFRLYWTLIGAFSGLIRREILQSIKRSAER